MLLCIERNTGLQISYEKTCIYRIGSLRNSNAQCYTARPLAWSDEDIQLLGVTITNDAIQSNASFDAIINKMDNVVNCWQHRQLSLMGKILLINTLMGSLFVYQMSVLPSFTIKQLTKIYELVNKFLWKGKRPKIPLKVLQNFKTQGGQKLVNFEIRQIAAHTSWIVKIVKDDQWKYVIHEMLPDIGVKIFQCNLHRKHCKILRMNESFWYDIVLSWCKYHCYNLQDQEEVLKQILWYNSHLLVRGEPIKPTKLDLNCTLQTVSDILDGNNEFLTIQQINDRHLINMNWLRYANIKASIPEYWRTLLNGQIIDVNVEHRLELEIVCKKKQPCQYVYNYLMENFHATNISRYAIKWIRKLDSQIAISEFIELFQKIKCLTDVIKLQDFQYRLLLNKIYANDTLSKWGKVTSDICNICKKEIQTTIHMLYYCSKAVILWKYVKEQLLQNLDNCFTAETVIFNTVHKNKKHVSKLITLVTKQFIYQSKCLNKQPTSKGLLAEVTFMYNLEKQTSQTNSKQFNSFEKKWRPVSIDKLFWK